MKICSVFLWKLHPILFSDIFFIKLRYFIIETVLIVEVQVKLFTRTNILVAFLKYFIVWSKYAKQVNQPVYVGITFLQCHDQSFIRINFILIRTWMTNDFHMNSIEQFLHQYFLRWWIEALLGIVDFRVFWAINYSFPYSCHKIHWA